MHADAGCAFCALSSHNGTAWGCHVGYVTDTSYHHSLAKLYSYAWKTQKHLTRSAKENALLHKPEALGAIILLRD